MQTITKYVKLLLYCSVLSQVIGVSLSYQMRLADPVSHTRCAGARLASPQTGGHTLQNDGALSPAPAPRMHTVPWFRLEHTLTTLTPRIKRTEIQLTKSLKLGILMVTDSNQVLSLQLCDNTKQKMCWIQSEKTFEEKWKSCGFQSNDFSINRPSGF